MCQVSRKEERAKKLEAELAQAKIDLAQAKIEADLWKKVNSNNLPKLVQEGITTRLAISILNNCDNALELALKRTCSAGAASFVQGE